MFLTALRTGMRLGELVALKPSDLDFNGGFVEVRRAFTKGCMGRPKNGTSRKVDMSKQLQEVLKRHLVTMKKDTLKSVWKELPEYLFYNEIGGMIDGNNLRRRTLSKALEKAGLRQVRLHDLRQNQLRLKTNLGYVIEFYEPGTLPRYEVKAKRFKDLRKSH